MNERPTSGIEKITQQLDELLAVIAEIEPHLQSFVDEFEFVEEAFENYPNTAHEYSTNLVRYLANYLHALELILQIDFVPNNQAAISVELERLFGHSTLSATKDSALESGFAAAIFRYHSLAMADINLESIRTPIRLATLFNSISVNLVELWRRLASYPAMFEADASVFQNLFAATLNLYDGDYLLQNKALRPAGIRIDRQNFYSIPEFVNLSRQRMLAKAIEIANGSTTAIELTYLRALDNASSSEAPHPLQLVPQFLKQDYRQIAQLRQKYSHLNRPELAEQLSEPEVLNHLARMVASIIAISQEYLVQDWAETDFRGSILINNILEPIERILKPNFSPAVIDFIFDLISFTATHSEFIHNPGIVSELVSQGSNSNEFSIEEVIASMMFSPMEGLQVFASEQVMTLRATLIEKIQQTHMVMLPFVVEGFEYPDLDNEDELLMMAAELGLQVEFREILAMLNQVRHDMNQNGHAKQITTEGGFTALRSFVFELQRIMPETYETLIANWSRILNKHNDLEYKQNVTSLLANTLRQAVFYVNKIFGINRRLFSIQSFINQDPILVLLQIDAESTFLSEIEEFWKDDYGASDLAFDDEDFDFSGDDDDDDDFYN